DLAHDRALVHAVAVAEGVAVQGDVARHRAQVGGGEQVPGPAGPAPARGRGVLAGRTQRGAAEVVRQAPAPARFHARVEVGGAVAQGAAPVRDRVPAPAGGIAFAVAPAAHALMHDADQRLVLQLVVPAAEVL